VPSRELSPSRNGSLKIRPPEFTLAAWVRDVRFAFHAKSSPDAGGQIFN
jgi:hypothetical protein